MGWFGQFFSYTIGKKIIMSLTGLFLILFLAQHLFGNLFIFVGEEAFNQYTADMQESTFIRVMEIVLFAGFIFHIADAAILTYNNRKKRKTRYAVIDPPARSTWFSRNMGLTGSIVLVFLVVHLRAFFYEHRVLGAENMYQDVIAAFSNPLYSGFYVLSMVLLGFHLAHGFSSAFDTLGLNHTKYSPALNTLGKIFAVLVPLGFASMPIYVLLFF